MEQSEQLLTAAAAVGYTARPLPLFYALSQAGRAIAAALETGDNWELSGHGINALPRTLGSSRIWDVRLREARRKVGTKQAPELREGC